MKTGLLNAATETKQFKAGGFCRRCGCDHWLGPGNTHAASLELMDQLEKFATIELFSGGSAQDQKLATAPLFGEARGKMFGVMECLQPDGRKIILRAFSGQFNGLWLADGWVPPLFEVDNFYTTNDEREKQIKKIGREIEQYQPHSELWLAKRKMRRTLSRQLMQDIHNLYRLTNFRQETASLAEAFTGPGGIPTGTGDCCAPKLLNFAANNNLRPLGISEFFWGRENKSKGYRQGSFSSSCKEKCQPILGFMLCGLDTLT